MKTNLNTGRIIGALFFIVMITWGVGFALIHPIITAPDYLSSLYPSKVQLTTGILFELVETACVLAITFLIFPIFKKYSEVQALAYVGFRLVEAMMLVTGVLAIFMLLTLSREFIAAGQSEVSHYETMGAVLKDLRLFWSIYVLAIFHPMAALPLYFFFYKTRLIPRFISVWGFLAATWVLIDQVVFESFGLGLIRIGDSPISGIPMGANEIVLGIWLMIKGFNEKNIPDLSRTNNI